MHSPADFPQPQLIAAVVALVQLSLALAIEIAMLSLSLRRLRERPAMAPEALDPDIYDWLYE